MQGGDRPTIGQYCIYIFEVGTFHLSETLGDIATVGNKIAKTVSINVRDMDALQ